MIRLSKHWAFLVAFSIPASAGASSVIAADGLKKPLEIADGTAQVPTGPGLGIEVDEEKVRDLFERSKAGEQS